jgi:photosystem II stability/assembly factor-like uncharacterized protein
MKPYLLFFFVLHFFLIPIDAQWMQLNGPGVAGTLCLLDRNGTMYTGTVINGVYKSTDGGSSWFAANSGIEGSRIKALAANDNYIFASKEAPGTGQFAGIYRSSDSGNTWEPANPGQTVISLFADGNNIYAGTVGNGVYKSTDNGNSWFQSNNGMGMQSVSGITKNGSRLYASGDNNLYYSTDEGANWFFTNGGQYFIIFSLSSFGNYMYAGGWQGLIRSTDGGLNWSNVIWIDYLIGFEHLTSFAFDGTNLFASTAGNGAAGVIKSTDLGLTWTLANDGIENVDVTQLLYSDNKWFAASEGKGVMVSINGIGWTKSNSGLPPGGIVRKLYNYNNTILAGTGFDGVYQSTDAGLNWNKLDPNGVLRNETILSLTSKDNYLFAGTSFHGIYRSSDNGNSWVHLTNGLPSTEFGTLALDAAGSNTLAGTGDALYWSTDNGDTWIPSSLNDATIVGIAVAGNYAYAIGMTGIFTTSGIYRSTNNGFSWDLVLQSGTTTPVSIAAKDNFVYAGDLFSGIISSYDYGISYPASALNQYGVFSILPLGDSVFIGTQPDSPESFKSDSYGLNWIEINQGLDSPLSMETLTNDVYFIYGGTTEKGIWVRPRDNPVSVELSLIPDKFELSQNYPNPFNPATMILYSLPAESFVSIKVYNVTGKEITTLVNQLQTAGEYQITFDGKNLASGVYLLRMTAGEFSSTIKMNLLK